MTRPALPAFERELRALAQRVKHCPEHEVHFQHGRAHEAVLALGVAERALRDGAAKARADARTELLRLQLELEAWERPENVGGAGAPASPAPPRARRPGPKKRPPAKPRRTAARRAA